MLKLIEKGATVEDLYTYPKLHRNEKLVLNLPKSNNPTVSLRNFFRHSIISLISEKICPIARLFEVNIEQCGGNISVAERRLNLRKNFIHDYLRRREKLSRRTSKMTESLKIHQSKPFPALEF